mmetsp:Transcript_25721/g.56896  ORF Transcript_25721/g.56896 Transcript_25721/m.56896 type:complete len:227 (+) Transcript_25721:117-797(+)
MSLMYTLPSTKGVTCSTQAAEQPGSRSLRRCGDRGDGVLKLINGRLKSSAGVISSSSRHPTIPSLFTYPRGVTVSAHMYLAASPFSQQSDRRLSGRAVMLVTHARSSTVSPRKTCWRPSTFMPNHLASCNATSVPRDNRAPLPSDQATEKPVSLQTAELPTLLDMTHSITLAISAVYSAAGTSLAPGLTLRTDQNAVQGVVNREYSCIAKPQRSASTLMGEVGVME